MFLLASRLLGARRLAFVFSFGVQHGVVCIAEAFGWDEFGGAYG
jgi:hypothetical protein